MQNEFKVGATCRNKCLVWGASLWLNTKGCLVVVGTTSVYRSSRGNVSDPSTFGAQNFHKYLSSPTAGLFPTTIIWFPNVITKSPTFLLTLFRIRWGTEGQRGMSCSGLAILSLHCLFITPSNLPWVMSMSETGHKILGNVPNILGIFE